MRPTRLAAAAVVLAPLALTGCLMAPPATPQASTPASSPAASNPPASSPPASSPPASSPPASSPPAATGDFQVSVDGQPVTGEFVATIECYMSSGFGAVSSDSDTYEDEYFSGILTEEGGQLEISLTTLATSDLSLIGTGEGASVTLEGGQISGSIPMTSNFSDEYLVEFSGPCSG